MCKSKLNECAREELENKNWFWLTELNETMGIVCGRNSSETNIADEFFITLIHLTRNVFNLYMRRFFFDLVY